MVPHENDRVGDRLRKYYVDLGAPLYGKQLRALPGIYRNLHGRAFVYHGFVDRSGKPVAEAVAGESADLWGYGADLQPALLYRKGAGDAEFAQVAAPSAFSPLLRLNVDLQNVLNEACNSAGIPPDHPSIATRLPAIYRITDAPSGG